MCKTNFEVFLKKWKNMEKTWKKWQKYLTKDVRMLK